MLSPSVWWSQRAILGYVAQTPVQARARASGWDVGTNEASNTVKNVTDLHDALVQRGWQDNQNLHFEVIQGAQHNEDAWARRVGPFLQFLFPAGDPQNNSTRSILPPSPFHGRQNIFCGGFLSEARGLITILCISSYEKG